MPEETLEQQQQAEQGQGENNPTTQESGEQQTEQQQQQQEDLKQFTQAQIDEMIKGAKAQVKKKFSDYDELKERAEKAEQERREREEAELTELQKAQKQLEERQQREDELQKQIEDMKQSQQEAKKASEFDKAARNANIPEQYLEDAKLLAGLSSIEDVEQISEAVKNLVENKPYLVEKPKQKPIGEATNGKQTKPNDKSSQQLLQEAADKARQTGRFEDKQAYVNLKHELGL